MKKVLAVFVAGALAAVGAWSQAKVIVSNAISVHEVPKYLPGFRHFDYVNSNAPKGGMLRYGVVGSFDNFNAFATRGVAPSGAETLYDTLMTASEDEPEVYYGLVADEVQYPTDSSWIVFHINPRARFQDGTPITAGDVVYSYNKFVNEGVPQFKEYFLSVTKAEVLDGQRVRFTLKQGSKEILVALGNSIAILPRKFWDQHNLGDPLATPPQGSGAWTVSDYRMGDYVVYQRLSSYWAADLPVNVGELNFQFIRYDFYRDESVGLEAFKAGNYDFREENVAKNWATEYSGPAFDAGYIVKKEIPNNNPPGTQALVFNTERPMFADRRVREAISYALDFEWLNKSLFYGQYTRTRSFFQNTKYQATGLPSAAELAILNPIRSQIPPEVFTQEYNPPKTDGSGDIRPEIVRALALLKEAGWEVRGEKLVNVTTGEPMQFELLLYDPTEERIAIPIKDNLARMGITMTIRLVDATQFTNRLRNREFDMITSSYPALFFPSSDLKLYWRSDFINSTYNTAGVQSKTIDYLIDGIAANQDNDAALTAWGRALDRVLTWNFYIIPEWYIASYRVAWWDKFGMPPAPPKYSVGVSTWWYDEGKAARIPKRY